jgi:hypothetical protein
MWGSYKSFAVSYGYYRMWKERRKETRHKRGKAGINEGRNEAQ